MEHPFDIDDVTDGSKGSKQGGNTKPPASGRKREIQAKRWVFTWNNYPSQWMEQVEHILPRLAKWIFTQEVGESGTPHIQGFIEGKTKLRPFGLLPKQVHWEKAKGNDEQQIQYITKKPMGPVHHSENMRPPKKIPLLEYEDMHPWQQRFYTLALSQLAGEYTNDREIFWVWERTGGYGKSALVKLLCARNGAMITSGKATDMKYMIVKQHEKTGKFPEIVLFDVPRSSLGYISYTGIEEIKNGCFASTKYECSVVVMCSPLVIVFANEPPDYSQMSMDRWNVIELTNDMLK